MATDSPGQSLRSFVRQRYSRFALPGFITLLFLTIMFARKGVYLPLVLLLPLAALLNLTVDRAPVPLAVKMQRQK